MLILTRKPGQSLTLGPAPGLDPATPLEQLFATGPIRVKVTQVRGLQVGLGFAAPSWFRILREELLPLPVVRSIPQSARKVLACRLRMFLFLRQLSCEVLAARAGVPLLRVQAVHSAQGEITLDDLERIARALGVKVSELFRPPGQTPEERLIMALLEGE